MAVEACMSGQKKNLMRVALSEANAEQEQDEKKYKLKVNKVLALKEDITQEVCRRVSAMQDREERAVLATAINALKRSDLDRALRVLEDRLVKVDRRNQRRGDSSDEDTDEEDGQDTLAKDAADQGAAVPARAEVVAAGSSSSNTVTTSGFVERIGGSLLTLGDLKAKMEGLGASSVRSSQWGGEHIKADVDAAGYFFNPQPPAAIQNLAPTILEGMNSLRSDGVPTFYIWMMDQPWMVMLLLWREAEAALGGECVLEPTFAAYHLDYQAATADGNQYNGTNFSLPHRDYTYSDTYDKDGALAALTIWVPVSDVTHENGCMFVVPKEFDGNYHRDEAYEHMLVQSSGWLQNKTFLSFPLAATRALAPAPAGSVMGWAGNTIHWGGQCHERAQRDPRASVAWVLRRRDLPHSPDTVPLTYDEVLELSAERRKALIEGSMAYFKHWSTPRDA